ncbi:MAG: DUF6036 family nucleotidyltransferase [Gemmatimonadota bacterium]
MKNTDIQTFLGALGEILAHERVEIGVILVGGAALLLQGLRSRTTTDIDVIAAVLNPDATGKLRLMSPADLPASFFEAVQRVARDFGLPANWINSEVATQLHSGLPPGFIDRITWHRYGGLWVGLAGRRDLIFLKLHATVDQDPASWHTQDLIALKPTHHELEEAAAWVRTQDASAEFVTMVDQVMAYVKAHSS